MMEQRIQARSEQVDQKFEISAAFHNQLKDRVSDQYGVCRLEHSKNDTRYEEIQSILEINRADTSSLG